ncbi:c-type cytochrome [Jannaschia rubra]|uniref:c-type cytochrome n=1 Tax=Jannaschia rubra TaxID=282197 RepID=UPI002491A514|nr:c-type cytochrome [Jannaschia rubra]
MSRSVERRTRFAIALCGIAVAATAIAPEMPSRLMASFTMTAQAQTVPTGEELALGRLATPDEIAAWDIDIRPDGAGLPDGSGDVWTGEELYVENCASCHGDFGESIGRWPQLAGGQGTLTRDRPVKTIGSYWPYLSTVYDYVHRAMPFGDAQSLSDDDVYAITAYLLYLNDLVDDDFVLDREALAGFDMPNVNGFYPDDRAETEFGVFSAPVCMEDCRNEVEITARAEVVDVTPDDETARLAREAAATGENSGITEADAQVTTPDGAAAPTSDPDLIAQGEGVFRQCKSCHQVGEGAGNRTGPVLNGVVGHQAGAVEGFRYSGALEKKAEAGLVWTQEELAAFLTAPRDYLPGTKMVFRGLRDEEERAAVIAYLQSIEE